MPSVPSVVSVRHLAYFTSVSRQGATVTWTGFCDSVAGTGAETVVATERNDQLAVRYVRGGNVLEGLTRCPAGR